MYRHLLPRHASPPPARPEVTLTIIPGWNLRQVAEYLVEQGFASTTADVFKITGVPATVSRTPVVWPDSSIQQNGLLKYYHDESLSFEGFFAPETFQVFKDEKLVNVLNKFLKARIQQCEKQENDQCSKHKDAQRGGYSPNEILTMASIIEKETKNDADRPIVADILWRRVEAGMPLQVDSSVHYAIDKTGDVFTTDKERQVDSPWNTYKYPGLPPGPICNPSVESIKAAINPQKNGYWYFLSGRDGTMYYAKTLEEHNANKKYL